MTQKTHWKKNIDSRYISGEDLKNGEILGKGLKPEMVVTVSADNDAEAFDQSTNKKVIKTALYLKHYPSGQDVYKPVLLNTENAKFFIKEFGSEFIEDWFGKPVVLFAKPDVRHGFVARFKKYFSQNPGIKPEDFPKAIASIENGTATYEQIASSRTLTAEQDKTLKNTNKKETENA